MSASSSAASSTISRSRGAVVVISALLCAFGSYYLYTVINEEGESSTPTGAGLHRSNAVHRRRRRTNTGTLHDGRTNPSADLPIFIDDVSADDNGNNGVARTLTDGETVVDDQAFQEEYGWSNVPHTYERNGQNIVQLLFRVSEDATRRNAYVHRGCECNSCGAVPIRGIRYHCANCADYDLCEGCESQGLHIKTHIFYKIRVPAPSFGPILSMPVAYSGEPDSAMRVLPKEITTKLSRETGFERPELDAYWEQWTFMANRDWRDDPDDINLAMDRKTFEHCLVPSGGYRQAAPSLIFDRMFAFYDTNNDDLIGFPEFLHGIAYRKKKDKWSKIFEGYDIDGDGFVDRKDFLRMFRSYYVLYRHMHRDMLGGMQEQQMITTEAHRLVNGRQPLSSAFGQDGRYPRAPDVRAGEGKTVQSSGDLEIEDGRGVTSESGTDTGNREEIFRRNPTRNIWNREREGTGYWETMLNPPESFEQMPDMLSSLNRVRGAVQEILHGTGPNPNAHPALLVPRDTEDDDETSDESDTESVSISDPENDHTWLPNFITVTDEDAEAVDGPGTRLVGLQRSSRRSAIVHAVGRERAQQDVHERWKRRQFYTDEEEGGTPPADWKEDEDILAQTTIAGESSTSRSRPSFHSRSSSKVRFAEDMDDVDTRSNPSTSSRSVPERWGGIEVPDAEKDAGKEILFQVTQQAFNELLDPLFKDKEDSAVEAAVHKDEIERYRTLYSTPDFHTWAQNKEAAEGKKTSREATFPEVEADEVRERSLEELLAATGYQVESTGENSMPDMEEVRRIEGLPRVASEEPRVSTGNVWQDPGNRQLVETTRATLPQPPTSPIEVLSIIAQYDDDRDPPSLSSELTPQVTPPESDSLSTSSYRDPTMPQFRPNTMSPPKLSTTVSGSDSFAPKKIRASATTAPQPLSSSPKPAVSHSEADSPPSQEKLYLLWKSDKASKEAEKRGGWGRLSYEEFESKVKKFIKEGKGNQMDYLGSWIEFCIP